MIEYNVLIPCTMAISVVVDADNEKEAGDKAINVDLLLKIESNDPAMPEIEEFEMHRQISEGNFYNGCINELDIEEI